MNKIRKGDEVVVLTGRDKSRRGTVLSRIDADHVLVEGINVVKRHTKQGVGGSRQAGIFEKEAPIPISSLMVIDPKTSAPTRVRRTESAEGRVRVSARSGETLLVPGKGR